MDDNLQREINTKRREIVELAKIHCNEGAHYLWGAQGQTPDPSGGHGVVLKPVNMNDPTFCAAALGSATCVGRYKAVGGSVVSLADAKTFKPSMDQVGWQTGLTPRKIFPYGDKRGSPTDYSTKSSLENKIIMGEGCDATMHFDCAGFVRYIVRQICYRSIEGLINTPTEAKQVTAGTHPGYPITSTGKPMGKVLTLGKDALWPGDILYYGTSHVAFSLYSAKTYTKGQQYSIIQAEDAAMGVHYSGTRSDHTKCIRINASALLGRDVADNEDNFFKFPMPSDTHDTDSKAGGG